MELLNNYKRRLKTIMNELKKGGNDLTINRLDTKASCYRTFINELESVLANDSTTDSDLIIPVVTRSYSHGELKTAFEQARCNYHSFDNWYSFNYG